MTKLINEDWEHAAYATDEMYKQERQLMIEAEYEESKYIEQKKPAVIIVQKPIKDENAHNTTNVQRAHQKKL